MYSTVPSVEPPSITMISSTQSRRSCGTMTRTASISLSVGNSSVVVSFTRHPLHCDVRKIPLIGQFKAFWNPDFCPPAQPRRAADIHQLTRHAVGLAGVEHDVAGIADDVLDRMGELADRDVLPEPDIDEGPDLLG